MAQAEPLHFMDAEEYLLFEQQATVRHEFVNGLMIAMAGASRRHNLLTLSLAALLRSHLKGTRCQVYASDMKVNASHKENRIFYYPDVMVACNSYSKNRQDDYVENNPQIIMDVLSPLTAVRDRMEKLAAYTALNSVKEYVLVDQEKIAVDIYQNAGMGWEVVRLSCMDDQLCLPSVHFSAPLSTVYEDVMDAL
ncbi:hypothetical protein CI610_03160 [invertebrate metagenome]|uniref:Putative restriction endonuclease domain-containing protein n=1 Tax=invertebrate metagenome TaxID=1711999 RepID=A0A2H9T3V2_9ZZZZ